MSQYYTPQRERGLYELKAKECAHGNRKFVIFEENGRIMSV